MLYLTCCYLFFVGSCLGSFIGLVVDRLPHQLGWREESRKQWTIVAPRSQCNGCHKTIPWLALIPIVGYCVTKGRCRNCCAKVPLRYPLSELFCGLLVALLFIYYGMSLQTLLAVTLLLSLFLLAWIDINEHWLPAVITIPLFWLGLLCTPWCLDPMLRIQGAALGFFLPLLTMYLVSKFKGQDVIAGGDVALISVAGAWFGLDKMLLYIVSSNLIFIGYSLPARFRGSMFQPMGPALALGFVICMLF